MKSKVDIQLSIDPGIGGTGICMWRVGSVDPLGAMVITPPRDREWVSKCTYIASEFAELLWNVHKIPNSLITDLSQIVETWCEWPAHMGGTTGYAAAGKGDILKLSYLVGRLAEVYHSECDGRKMELVPVADWKGQMPKDVTNRRIAKELGDHPVSGLSPVHKPSHDWDALGIGLYKKGRFE